MSVKHALSFGFIVSCAALFVACGGEGSASAPAGSGAPTSKPTATAAMTATAAVTATATAAPTASATAAPAAGGVVGAAAGEMFAVGCDSIAKDSECGDIVITNEADKAKNEEIMKKLCKDTITSKPCSADKMVGTCRVMKDIVNHYYEDGPKKYTAETAQKACEKAHGKWIAK